VKNNALINTPMSFYIDFMGCHMFGQRACPGWKITRWPASLETCNLAGKKQFRSMIWGLKGKIIILDCLFQVNVNSSKLVGGFNNLEKY